MSIKPITLDLSSRGRDRLRAVAATGLACRLLDLIAGCASDQEGPDAPALRAALEGHRARLADDIDADEVDRIAEACERECADFLSKLRQCDEDREARLTQLLQVLRDVMETVRGGDEQADGGIAQSTARLQRALEIDDLRELKRTLAREVEQLKQSVADKRRRDEQQYAKLSSHVTRLELNLKEANEEAARDSLTRVANRGTFDRTLEAWHLRARRSGEPFVLALIDVDDLKAINDEHGHLVGDRVLVCVGQHLARFIGPNDVVARYGGDEFVLLLANTTLALARHRLTNLTTGLAPHYEYEELREKRHVAIGFSVGATEVDSADTGEAMIERADEALYKAKRGGKHRLETRGPSMLRRILR